MRFGSVCSGIEAASVAWTPLGWKASWFAEIEPFPSAVLAYRFPEVPNLGDMTTLPDRIRSGEVEAPDVFAGGTPCQAFSVAGLRRSLEDERGNLSLTFCEIANAIDDIRRDEGRDPSVVFWENVPGVLSTRDNAFGCFLAGLAGESEPLLPAGEKWTNAGAVFGPKRAVAWRLLDAQYFGLAQRRRRVFVVASARDGFDPAAILFEREGVRRDTAPSRETGQAVAPTIAGCANGGGANGPGRDVDSVELMQVVPSVAYGGSQPDVADTVTSKWAKGSDGPAGNECGLFVAHALRGEGFVVSEDGTGRGTPLMPHPISIHPHCIGRAPESGPQGKEYLTDGTAYCIDSRGQPQAVVQPVTYDLFNVTAPVNRQNRQPGDPCHTLARSNAEHAAVVGAQPVGIFQDSEFGVQQYDSAGTLRAGRIPEHQMVMQPVAVATAVSENGDIASTLRTGGNDHADVYNSVAVALRGRDGGATAEVGDDCAFALRASSGGGDKPHVMQPIAFHPTQDPITSTDGSTQGNATVAVAVDTYNHTVTGDYTGSLTTTGGPPLSGPGVMVPVAPSLTASNDPSRSPQSSEVTQQVAAVLQASMQVRRLTPVECERLQGFPDNYTAIPWRKKPAEECPDGPRYKALGNSWAVPVVRWIGARIDAAIRSSASATRESAV